MNHDPYAGDPRYTPVTGEARKAVILAQPAYLRRLWVGHTLYIGPWPYECVAKGKNPGATVYHCNRGWWHS